MTKRASVIGVLAISTILGGVPSQAGAAALYVEPADVLEAAEESASAVTLVAGWNLISLPRTPSNSARTALFPNSISAFRFVPGTGYQAQSSLDPCEGYWVNNDRAETVVITGPRKGDCSSARPSAWNLVGVPRLGTFRANIGQTPANNIVSVFRFVPGSGYAQVSDADVLHGQYGMQEGWGYWVNLQTGQQLALDGRLALRDDPDSSAYRPRAGKLAVDVRRDVTVTRSTLTAISGQGRQTLQLGVAAEGIVEMPPLPPAGALDARVLVGGVGTQSVPAPSQALDYRLQLQGENLELAWDIEAVDADRWQLVVDGVTHRLTGTGSVRLAQAPQGVWLRYLAAAPQHFALHANYPNPFNPSTTIRYELAAAAQVQLVVYDLLGQQIRSLVDLHQPAGGYSVVWDGLNENGQQVANGLYFYEIKAGSFQGVRKMMLSK